MTRWGFPKIGMPFLGVPARATYSIYGETKGGTTILGNTQIGSIRELSEVGAADGV